MSYCNSYPYHGGIQATFALILTPHHNVLDWGGFKTLYTGVYVLNVF